MSYHCFPSKCKGKAVVRSVARPKILSGDFAELRSVRPQLGFRQILKFVLLWPNGGITLIPAGSQKLAAGQDIEDSATPMLGWRKIEVDIKNVSSGIRFTSISCLGH